MPTGYTSFIENGQVRDAKQFLHLCLRNFGVCYGMDDPLEIKEDYTQDIINRYDKEISWHQLNLDNAKARLEEIKSLTDDELCAKYIHDTVRKIENLKRLQADDIFKYGNYLRIREDIDKWECSEQFQEIKNFALQQIDCSINKSSYFEEQLSRCGKPTKEEFEKNRDEYLNSLIDPIRWDIDYHTKEIEREEKAKKECLKFYEEFKEEMGKIKSVH